ncbi:heme peroxidase, partial [Chytriomyces sp. MP71]
LKQDIAYQVKLGNGSWLVRQAWADAGTWNMNDGSGGPHAQKQIAHPGKDFNMLSRETNCVGCIPDPIITSLKQKYPGVSKADIISFAGAVSISGMGGPTIRWRPGRNDAVDQLDAPFPDGVIPNGTANPDILRYAFLNRMGFKNDRDIVALLGAHNLGNCHLAVSGYAGPWTTTPNQLTNEYYTLLVQNFTFHTQIVSYKNTSRMQWIDNIGRMMLPSDMALTQDSSFLSIVQQYATNKGQFFGDFATSFAHVLELGVS